MENHLETILIHQIKFREGDCATVAWQFFRAILEQTDKYNATILKSGLVDLAILSCDSQDNLQLKQAVLTDLALLLTSATASQMKVLAEKKVIELVFEDPSLYSSSLILTSALQNIVNVWMSRIQMMNRFAQKRISLQKTRHCIFIEFLFNLYSSF